MMDGVFNNTVHSKPLNDVDELNARIAGLLKRVGDLQGEVCGKFFCRLELDSSLVCVECREIGGRG